MNYRGSRPLRSITHGHLAVARVTLCQSVALFAVFALAPVLAPAHAHAFDTDWVIVPGVRVGSITAATTETDLPLLFPHTVPKRGRVYVGEGEERSSTVLFARSPDELHVVWVGDAFQRIEEIRLAADAYRRPRWRTTAGITIGTTLEELSALNGGPFELFGFRWDYGGTLRSWKGGRLTRTHHLGEDIVIRLRPIASLDALGLTPTEDHSISGERPITSSAPVLTKLRLSISEIIVRLRR